MLIDKLQQKWSFEEQKKTTNIEDTWRVRQVDGSLSPIEKRSSERKRKKWYEEVDQWNRSYNDAIYTWSDTTEISATNFC